MSRSQTHSPEDRQSAAERREAVLEAALSEFAEHGYRAARTANIAERAGISQPYIYALFPNKKSLFLACQDLVRARIRAAFEGARDLEGTPEQRLVALGERYRPVLSQPDLLRCQLQGFAAADDPEIRANVRAGMIASLDAVRRMTGASAEQVADFAGRGLFLNVAHILDLPQAHLPQRRRN